MPRSRPAMLMPGLALNVLISSGTFLVAKGTVAEFPPLVLALLRFVLATGLLWPLVRVFRRDERIAREDRPRIWLLGLLVVPLNQALFLVGMKWASASHGALLYALTPAFVVLIIAARGGARPNLAQLAGVVIAFAGVALLLFQRGLHFDRHSVRGDVLVFIAVITWAMYIVAGRRMSRRYSALVVTAESLLAGTLLYLPVGLVALRGFDPRTISPAGWTGLLYLAWLTSGLNYVLWFWGLSYLKAATIAMITNIQPLVTAALAWLLLHERLPGGFVLSTALVLAGVWLTRAAAPEPAPAPATSGGGR